MSAKPSIIHFGDCLETLRTMPDESVDAVVTDPPYGLSKEPHALEMLRHWLAGEVYTHGGSGFMGKTWDSFVPGPEVWKEVIRVLKPGGHALVFSGTRTYDLTVMAMRIAGFEIRDQLAWMYAVGFPKSKNAGRAIDLERCTLPGRHYDATLPKGTKALDGDHLCPAHLDGDPWRGHGVALKPAQEPICLARKPLSGTVAANVLAHGTGAINIDGCRIDCTDKAKFPAGVVSRTEHVLGGGVGLYDGRPRPDDKSPAGRWPANVILDEAAAEALDAQSGGASRFFYVSKTSRREREAGLKRSNAKRPGELTGGRKDGSAGLDSPRAGAGRTAEHGRSNTHPTVKPVKLMRYLIRLITPPGGVVLDPYTGSGTTGIAAALEGAEFIGCELSEEFCKIAESRIELCRNNLPKH